MVKIKKIKKLKNGMGDDWEKLSDEKSSLRACRRRIPNRSRVIPLSNFDRRK